MKSLMLAVKSPMHAGPLVESGPAHFAGLNSNCSAARYSIVATASRQFDYPIKLAKRDHPVLATISRLQSRRMSWKIILREHSGIFSDRSNWVSWRNRLKCKHLRNTPSRSRTYNLRFRRPFQGHSPNYRKNDDSSQNPFKIAFFFYNLIPGPFSPCAYMGEKCSAKRSAADLRFR